MEKYDHKQVEEKWQKVWAEKKADEVNADSAKPKYYCLIEFPYPSGEGLHVGHVRSNTAMDIVARKRRAEGFNVLYPIGWDAFGLPTENYAIKTGIQPAVVTKQNTNRFRTQLKSLGFSFDWSREVNTSVPEYYRWTQWIFLQLYKQGLAYKKKMTINWCPKCLIGLANEEVINGACERCGTPVEKKEKEQWMLAITKYADRLDKDLDTVDYLEKIKIQQRNWIGRSEGAEFEFPITGAEDKIKVFTTRADTLFGVTYLVLAPEHPLVEKLKPQIKNWSAVEKYLGEVKNKTEIERTTESKEKTGVVLEGVLAVNPASGETVPVWVADYVLAGYGTGAVMAVPAHDERDFAFAKKYQLPIKPVILRQTEESYSYVMGVNEEELKSIGINIVEKTKDGDFKIKIPVDQIQEFKKLIIGKMKPHFWCEFSTPKGFHFIFKHKDERIEEVDLDEKSNDLIDKYGSTFNNEEPSEKPKNVYSWLAENSFYKGLLIHVDNGLLVNSQEFNGLTSEEAREKIAEKFGAKKVTYKLRDWIFSRQRYWGEPIPMVKCDKCGWQPVPEDKLPIVLPEVERYQPTQTGESPLADVSAWVNTTCPHCGGPAKRETDTMPNWAGSSWYYLRYADPGNPKEFAGRAALDYWTPVDWYNGGMEHTTLHLLYSRFWHKALFDLGLVPTTEPYKKRTAHGFILASDGEKMSKSRGNVINPDDIVARYGADTFRVYEMFMGPFDQAIIWNTEGLMGPRRFLERVWKLSAKVGGPDFERSSSGNSKSEPQLSSLLHQTIKKVGDDIESLRFNTAISALMILVNAMEGAKELSRESYETLLRLLAPFAPHLTEELWQSMGHQSSVHPAAWPVYDESLAREQLANLGVQVNGVLRDTLPVSPGLEAAEAERLARASAKVSRWLEGKTVKKVVYVPGRILNFVV